MCNLLPDQAVDQQQQQPQQEQHEQQTKQAKIHLPYEMWDLIASFLEQEHLYQLCLVNTTFARICQRRLYANILVVPTQFSGLVSINLISLALTLHRRPDLASRVRQISFHGPCCNQHGRCEYRETDAEDEVAMESRKLRRGAKKDYDKNMYECWHRYTDHTLERRMRLHERWCRQDADHDLVELARAAMDLPLPFAPPLAVDVECGTVDGLITFVLALTTNVTSIALYNDASRELNFLHRLIRYSIEAVDVATTERPLHKVTEVICKPLIERWRDNNNPEHTWHPMSFLHLPTVKRATIRMDGIYRLDRLAELLPDRLDHLTSLTVTRLPIHALVVLLQRTGRLEWLSWEWYYDGIFRGLDTDALDLNHLGAALSYVQESLAGLRLLTLVKKNPEVGYPRIQGSLDALLKFSRLEKVQVSPWLFCQTSTWQRPIWGSVPRSVEEIGFMVELNDDDGGEHAMARVEPLIKLGRWWLSQRETNTPQFKKFVLVEDAALERGED